MTQLTPPQASKVRSRLPSTDEIEACGLTIGSFDGVHLGHQAIIHELVARCREQGLKSRVLTFHPRPAQYFAGSKAAPSLMGWREKVSVLTRLGLDEVICLPFDQDIRQLTADQFVERVIVAGLRARLVMIGDDFRFGNDRLGDYELLQQHSRSGGFEVIRSPTVEQAGERISSSRIRAALARGDLAAANALLGHPYFIQGRVQPGQQLGRSLGARTANIPVSADCLPMTGVFVVEVELPGGERHFGAANLGFRPAVETRGTPILEVHLLDFDENLYGRRLCVSFLKRIREERNFASHDELGQQIARDIEEARRWLASRKP